MRVFPERPRLEVIRPGRYRTLEYYKYQWTKDGIGHRIIVLAGIETDLASIPKFLHSLIGPQDLGLGAPLIHDALYQSRGKTGKDHPAVYFRKYDTWSSDVPRWDRKSSDRLFGRHMRERGIPVYRRRAAYWAVRGFGWFAW